MILNCPVCSSAVEMCQSTSLTCCVCVTLQEGHTNMAAKLLSLGAAVQLKNDNSRSGVNRCLCMTYERFQLRFVQVSSLFCGFSLKEISAEIKLKIC